MRPGSQREAQRRHTRALLRCGVLAGPLFVGASAVQGALRPDYRAWRHPVSSLSIGRGGPIQSANFVIAGGLCAALAAGLARLRPGSSGNPGSSGGASVAGARQTSGTPAGFPRTGPAAIALGAAGLIISGMFTADPVNGYPPGTPLTPLRMTRPGYTHLIASTSVMLGVPVATALYGAAAERAGDHRWARTCFTATVLTAGSFGAACAGFAQVPPLAPVAGGLQRLAVTGAFCWLTALALRALRGGGDAALAGPVGGC